jgi:hypothetical protein
MTARIHARGRNHWHSDGRPAGFGAPLARSRWPSWQAFALGAFIAACVLAGALM